MEKKTLTGIGNMDVDEQHPQRTRRPRGPRPRQSRSNSFTNSGHARALSLASGGASVRSLGVGSLNDAGDGDGDSAGDGDSVGAASSQGRMGARDIAAAAATASASASSLRRGHGSTDSLSEVGGTASGSSALGRHNFALQPRPARRRPMAAC